MLVDEVETYALERDVLLPAFDIPSEFVHAEDAKDGGKRGENAYLRHITFQGAEKRYSEITEEVREAPRRWKKLARTEEVRAQRRSSRTQKKLAQRAEDPTASRSPRTEQKLPDPL